MRLKKTLVSAVLLAVFLILMLGVGEANASGIYQVDDSCDVVYQEWSSTGSSIVTLEPTDGDEADVQGSYGYESVDDNADLLGKRLPYTVEACNPYPFSGTEIKCQPQCEVGFSVQWDSDDNLYPGAIMSYTGSIMNSGKTKTCDGNTIKNVARMRLVVATVTQDDQNVRNVGISKTTFYPADCQ